MFGVQEEGHKKRAIQNRQEWWFTLEPNPIQEFKTWEAKIEGQWWVCEANGSGDFHIVKYDRHNGKGINLEGLFLWLTGFGIDRDMVVKYKARGLYKDVKWEEEDRKAKAEREAWLKEHK